MKTTGVDEGDVQKWAASMRLVSGWTFLLQSHKVSSLPSLPLSEKAGSEPLFSGSVHGRARVAHSHGTDKVRDQPPAPNASLVTFARKKCSVPCFQRLTFSCSVYGSNREKLTSASGNQSFYFIFGVEKTNRDGSIDRGPSVCSLTTKPAVDHTCVVPPSKWAGSARTCVL